MSENSKGVYIFPDADEFLKVMEELQEAYNNEREDGDS